VARNEPRKTEGTPSPLKTASPFGYVLLLVLGFFLFRNLFEEAGVRKVAYSDFKVALKEGRFDRVQLSDTWVRGFLPAPPQDDASAKVREEAARRGPPGLARPAASLPWYAHRVQGDAELLEILEREGIRYEAVPSSGMADLLLAWLIPLGLALLFWIFLARRLAGMGQGPQGVMSFGKSRAKIQSEPHTGVKFVDVAGIDEAVEELQEIVDFLKYPDKFRRLGGRIPRGVLLVGPPGTGKTLLARAVAGEAGVPFFSLSGSEFVEMFVGVGAARVRDLFAQATARAPAIIFIDELDAIGKSRNAATVGGHDEREQTLNQLLAEMDGFDPRAGLIILAATNRPEVLDSALLRPGRFDRHVLVDRPDRRGREAILAIHAARVKVGPDVELRTVAAHTPGFAGADLANVVNEAALLAARRDREFVTRADFDEAVERVVAGLEKKNRRMNEREKEIVAHHEAGHTLVSWMLPNAPPVTKVSIIPRGLAALGYTMSLPLEDRYLMSFPELRDKLAGMMGGRAAEELFVGEISTGAANDLQQATEIARLMVREYGMSALGPVALGPDRGPAFLKSAGAQSAPNYSERTAQEVDQEVRRLVVEALDRARAVLQAHRSRAQAVAARLLTHEVIEEELLRELLGPKVVPPSGLLHPEGAEVRDAPPHA